jgi:hypothetical protein
MLDFDQWEAMAVIRRFREVRDIEAQFPRQTQ